METLKYLKNYTKIYCIYNYDINTEVGNTHISTCKFTCKKYFKQM